MRTAIIAAMDEEVQFLIEHIDQHEHYEFQGYDYHIGRIEGKKIALCKSGIGKVNAALSTALLLEHFKIEQVINTGSAGAIGTTFSVGDIVIADKCIYHDADSRAFGYEYGQIPQMPRYYNGNEALISSFKHILTEMDQKFQVGTVATGDSFMNSQEKFEKMKALLPDVQAVDMEATAITQVCRQYNIPFIVVRSISDVVGKDSNISFDQYIDLAAKNSTEVIVEFLKRENQKQD